jgi:hypothetical protein
LLHKDRLFRGITDIWRKYDQLQEYPGYAPQIKRITYKLG